MADTPDPGRHSVPAARVHHPQMRTGRRIRGWLGRTASDFGGSVMAVHGGTRQQVEDPSVVPRFTRAGMVEVPKHQLPEHAMLPQTAYQIVMDEVMLDGNARFNLATFVTTWMDEEADRLYAATFDKNMVDKDEYPQTAEIEARCVRMLADLWRAPDAAESVGTSTT